MDVLFRIMQECVMSSSGVPYDNQSSNREHLLLISDRARPAFKLVHLIDVRPQDVIKLLHVLCSVLLADVTDQRCICLIFV